MQVVETYNSMRVLEVCEIECELERPVLRGTVVLMPVVELQRRIMACESERVRIREAPVAWHSLLC